MRRKGGVRGLRPPFSRNVAQGRLAMNRTGRADTGSAQQGGRRLADFEALGLHEAYNLLLQLV